jgi:RimJ/RimL family protein N-acetyltransferase
MLESERLILRKFEKNDLDSIHAMRNDADVMRYIREVSLAREESAKWMDLISALWENEGIGYCAVVEKETGDVAGWCGTWKIPETGEIEVGYAIAKEKWGNGYATEAAAAAVDHAFRRLKLERIVAVAYPENTASIRVMEKLGMKFVRTGEFYAKELVQYAIGRDEWEALKAKAQT